MMSESIPEWKRLQLEAERNRLIKSKLPDLGKIVRYKGDTGVVTLSPDKSLDDYTIEQLNEMHPVDMQNFIAVRWDTDKEYDYEQYGFFRL
jgi:hypothetical protein